jgi:phosphopantothenoylcysteine decarboxylase / phosphopantothenate---cysteine ligase
MNSSVARRKKHLKSQANLKNKCILLGISGGIAAYKSVDLTRRLKDEEASVVVIMTEASKHFVTPLSLQVASGNRVYTSLFEEPMAHITLTASADVMVIAPATANIIAKFANGIADDLLSTCFLSFSGKVIMAPSMNWRMYENRALQENLKKVASFGVTLLGPEKGPLACGDEGIGRMSDILDIVDTVKAALTKNDLVGMRIVVTAGPTREYLDPVRFISNRSSGKMGFSLAEAARNRGADVTLISGPSSLKRPTGTNFISVETAGEMKAAVKNELRHKTTVLIMAAAVSDFSPLRQSQSKIEKMGEFSLRLRSTDDIISAAAGMKKRPFIIGFAAETGGHIDRATQKMKKKNMDMIVFNDVTQPGSGFDVDTNRVVIIDRKGKRALSLMSKGCVANAILDRFIEIRT